ncbi:hypothetical protein CU098_008448, partial [Rhizopus stolonifer]
MSVILPEEHTTTMHPIDTQTPMHNTLTMTLWNANGCNCYIVDQTTNMLLTSLLIFITETCTHTYGIPPEGQSRGQMGISLLVNPDCPYPVTHFSSSSPYVLSCQVSSLLVHCVYLPPSLSDLEAIEVLDSLPAQTHPSQTNTIVCGDFNARYQQLIGGGRNTRTTTRGIKLFGWILENGMTCWNSQLAYGVATYCVHSRVNANTDEHFNSLIDLFLNTKKLVIPTDSSTQRSPPPLSLFLGSDHHPVTLTCSLSPSPPLAYPRHLWNLSRLSEPYCLYVELFKD